MYILTSVGESKPGSGPFYKELQQEPVREIYKKMAPRSRELGLFIGFKSRSRDPGLFIESCSMLEPIKEIYKNGSQVLGAETELFYREPEPRACEKISDNDFLKHIDC